MHVDPLNTALLTRPEKSKLGRIRAVGSAGGGSPRPSSSSVRLRQATHNGSSAGLTATPALAFEVERYSVQCRMRSAHESRRG